jgi:hypothetical protein
MAAEGSLRVFKGPLLVPTLRQINPVQAIQLRFFET